MSVPTVMSTDGKNFFSELVRDYLNIPGVIGIQSAAGAGPDLLLFRGSRQQTLAVPLSLLFEESKESAREFIAEKMAASDGRFSLQVQQTAPGPPWRKVERLDAE